MNLQHWRITLYKNTDINQSAKSVMSAMLSITVYSLSTCDFTIPQLQYMHSLTIFHIDHFVTEKYAGDLA